MLNIGAETLKGKTNCCIKSILCIILFLAHVYALKAVNTSLE